MVKYIVFGQEQDLDISKELFPSEEKIQEMERIAQVDDCEHGWLDSVADHPNTPSRKAKLHYRKWMPSSLPPKAIVIYMHGIQTHSGLGFVVDEQQQEEEKEEEEEEVAVQPPQQEEQEPQQEQPPPPPQQQQQQLEKDDDNNNTNGSKKKNNKQQRQQQQPKLYNMAFLIESLVRHNGYALYALDMLGHGYSEGMRFFIPDWKVNRDDYIHFVKHVAKTESSMTTTSTSTTTNTIIPPPPMFLCGISYGGNLTIHVGKFFFHDHPKEKPSNLNSMILLAPAIVPSELPPYPIYATLRYCLAPMFPQWVPFFMPHPVNPKRIWRDPILRQLHEQDEQVQMNLDGGGRPFHLGTAVNLLLALEDVRINVIPFLQNVPFCVIHGKHDYAVPVEGTELLRDQYCCPKPTTDREVHIHEEAYHDLLCDPDTENIINDYVVGWISKRI